MALYALHDSTGEIVSLVKGPEGAWPIEPEPGYSISRLEIPETDMPTDGEDAEERSLERLLEIRRQRRVS